MKAPSIIQIGVGCLVCAVVTTATVILQRPSETRRPGRPHRLQLYTPSVCEVAGAATNVVKAKIVSWGRMTMSYSATAGGNYGFTPVVVDVAETLKGTLSGRQTVQLGGSFDAASGTFADGVLQKGEEVYFASRMTDGVELMLGMGYWPIEPSPSGSSIVHASARHSDAEFRARVAGQLLCTPIATGTPQ